MRRKATGWKSTFARDLTGKGLVVQNIGRMQSPTIRK
jgi:hypothetical protein